jgi:hypothetical protein
MIYMKIIIIFFLDGHKKIKCYELFQVFIRESDNYSIVRHLKT